MFNFAPNVEIAGTLRPNLHLKGLSPDVVQGVQKLLLWFNGFGASLEQAQIMHSMPQAFSREIGCSQRFCTG